MDDGFLGWEGKGEGEGGRGRGRGAYWRMIVTDTGVIG